MLPLSSPLLVPAPGLQPPVPAAHRVVEAAGARGGGGGGPRRHGPRLVASSPARPRPRVVVAVVVGAGSPAVLARLQRDGARARGLAV